MLAVESSTQTWEGSQWLQSLKKTDSLFPEIHILNSERPQLLAGLLLLYSTKLSIQIEGEIKRFHGKNLLTEFISLSQIYKEF